MTTTRKLAGTFLLAAALFAGMMATAPTPAFAQGQEEMNESIEHLRQAKASLEHASKSHGGHREAAIHLVDQAISEVEAGKQYANEHRAHDGDHDHDRR